MKNPTELLYSKSHEWVKFEGDGTAVIGLTDFAQNALGDLVYIGLPEVGDEAIKEDRIADVESVKAVSDVFSPVSGIVTEINEALLDSPEMVNDSPYEAWLYKVAEVTDKEDLLEVAAYEKFCEEEA